MEIGLLFIDGILSKADFVLARFLFFKDWMGFILALGCGIYYV